MLSFQDMFNKDPNSLSTARVMCQIPPEEQTYQSVVGGRELTIDQGGHCVQIFYKWSNGLICADLDLNPYLTEHEQSSWSPVPQSKSSL